MPSPTTPTRRGAGLNVPDQARDARGRAVVGGGLAAPLRGEILLAVHDHAVHQAADGILLVSAPVSFTRSVP